MPPPPPPPTYLKGHRNRGNLAVSSIIGVALSVSMISYLLNNDIDGGNSSEQLKTGDLKMHTIIMLQFG